MSQEAREQSTAQRRFSSYQILMHIMLIGLAATVFGLIQKNQELRESRTYEQGQSPLDPGEALTAFSASDLHGGSQLIDFTESDRESLIFVFTTVCPACRENQANWTMLYEQFMERYEILGISLNDIGATLEYYEANEIPFPVVVPDDIRGFTAAHKIDQVPLTLQVDHEGKVRSSWLGVLNESFLAQLSARPAENS